MEIGEIRAVTAGACRDLSLIETGMYDVTGYGGVYLLDAERPAIIETGIGRHTDSLLDAIEEFGIDPSSIEVIAVTHVHLDHAGGAGALARACENAQILVHERGAPHLIDPGRLIDGTKAAVGDQWQYYGTPTPVPADRVTELSDDDVISLGDHELHVHHAPGHAPHQVVYHDSTMDAVFTGDAAGIWVADQDCVIETTPPPNFNLEQARKDVETIAQCRPETLLYTHFGPAEYHEKLLGDYKHRLTEWVKEVEDAREQLPSDRSVIEHFVDQAKFGSVWSPAKARAERRLNVTGVLTYLDRYREDTD